MPVKVYARLYFLCVLYYISQQGSFVDQLDRFIRGSNYCLVIRP